MHIILFALWAGATAEAQQASADPVAERLQRRTAEVRAQYDDVRHVTPEVLSGYPVAPLLIDVRKPEEYAVSRLPGAVHAPDAERLLEVARLAGDRPIVVYCSLGVRSSIAARTLATEGFTDVANLDGSIFGWANAGLPLENDLGATDKAHPFNAWWGRYLRRKLHARSAPAGD